MEEVEADNNQNLLFKIDNTRYFISACIGGIWFVAYILTLLILLTKEDNMSYGEWAINMIHVSGKFIPLLISVAITILIAVISIYRLKKNDNKIYFKNDKVVFKDIVIKNNQIKAIRMGCCIVNGGFFAYLYVYTIGFLLIAPWMLFEIVAFFIIKFKYKTFDGSMPCRFIIKGDKSIQGYCYDKETKMKLMNFKEQILKGEK